MEGKKRTGIFVRSDGSPFLFSMMRTAYFAELKPLIEEYGGMLVPSDDPILSCDQAMTLISDADEPKVDLVKGLLFHYSFVADSCEAQTLKNPFDYRVPIATKYEISDPQQVIQILRGEKKWSDFLPMPRRRPLLRNRDLSGESCSDIEEIQVLPKGKRKIKTIKKQAAAKRVSESPSLLNQSEPQSDSSESSINVRRQPHKRPRERSTIDSSDDESLPQTLNSESIQGPEGENAAVDTPSKSISLLKGGFSQTKRTDRVNLSLNLSLSTPTNENNCPSVRHSSGPPTTSQSYNEAHRPSPLKNSRPGARIRLFNHGKSGPEQLDENCERKERDQRVQAKAAEVIITRPNSIEEFAQIQTRLTVAFDSAKRQQLRPILAILDVLIEYELLDELTLDTTWRFVSYLLQDDTDNMVSPQDLKTQFLCEMLPSVLTDYNLGLAPFYHKNEGFENRLYRRITSPRIVPIDIEIENRLIDILVSQNLFELKSNVVWKFLNVCLPLEGYSHQELREYFFEKMLPHIDTFKNNFNGKMKEFLYWKSQSLPKQSINDVLEDESLEASNSGLNGDPVNNRPVLNGETKEVTPTKRVKPRNIPDLLLRDPTEMETEGDDGIKTDTKELRKLYSRAEDIKIIDYVAKSSRYSEVNGMKLWHDVVQDQILPNRTHQSLHERFRRKILPKIDTFEDCFSKTVLSHIKNGAKSKKKK